MGRRIEVELTSTRDDGSWTWRAAGAKQPKGDVQASLLYDGAKIGDVVKVEAEFHLDGIEITEVFAPKQKKGRTDLLEMKSRPLRDDELVTTQRVARNDRRGDRRGDRGGARGRSRGEGRGDRGDNRRGPRPEPERRPKPKRLRPKRVHRDALLAEVTEEHRPIVEQVLRDGMPGVRAAIEKQNSEAKSAGKPEIDPSPIIAIAEKNLGPARLAEWRDRADAALADGEELDIRDLRSVVVAGTDLARDDESRAQVERVKTLLDQRLESDHTAWLQDLDAAVEEGRVVRGLRLSSRPVKAGAPLPTEVASKLADQASQALASDVAQDRWATVLDALAFSPVRGAVTPASLPAEPGEELLSEVRRLSDRIPAIANLFGVDPATVPKSAKRRRSPRRDGGNRGGRGGQQQARQGEQGRKSDRPVPGAEPKAEAPTEPATENESGKDQATDQQPETAEATAAVTEAPAATDETSEATPAPDAEGGADTSAPAPEADAETKPEAVAAPAADTEPEAVAAPEADAEPEPEAVAAPEADAEPEAAPEAGDAPEPPAEAAPEASPEPEAPASDEAPADEAEAATPPEANGTAEGAPASPDESSVHETS